MYINILSKVKPSKNNTAARRSRWQSRARRRIPRWTRLIRPIHTLALPPVGPSSLDPSRSRRLYILISVEETTVSRLVNKLQRRHIVAGGVLVLEVYTNVAKWQGWTVHTRSNFFVLLNLLLGEDRVTVFDRSLLEDCKKFLECLEGGQFGCLGALDTTNGLHWAVLGSAAEDEALDALPFHVFAEDRAG